MKRIAVFSDGLWTSPSVPGDSNLSLLARALGTGDAEGTPQMILTDPCQGLAQVGPCGRRMGLLRESVCELYRQIAANYNAGDSLWFFGFSRGSFVVRSCIGLIRNLGLLQRIHLDRTAEAWHIYRTNWGADAKNAVRFRSTFSQPATVRFLGAFDTLGNLGVPPPLTKVAEPEYPRFHDRRLSKAVEFACHALAIDERRRNFAPCLWRTRDERGRSQQCWFTGNHRDIGGIQGDPALANISLRWMAARAGALGLVLDRKFLDAAMAGRHGEQGEEYQSGRIRNSGSRPRPIGTGNGDEILHPSAEQRFLRDRNYRPANLRAYMLGEDQIQLPI